MNGRPWFAASKKKNPCICSLANKVVQILTLGPSVGSVWLDLIVSQHQEDKLGHQPMCNV